MSEAFAPPSSPSAATRRRGADTRERLLEAARQCFCEAGYVAASAEDIAAAAAVTRMTLYRHFSGKAALAIALYREAELAALPRLLALGQVDVADPAAVRAWIATLFAADRRERRLLRAFNQAAAVEPAFTARAHEMIAGLIERLGQSLPAFAVDSDRPDERRRWLEAWLLLYEVLDQSNHAAIGSGVADDPAVVDILAARVLAFVAG